MRINSSHLSELDICLHYFHVAELKEMALQLQLTPSGKKCELIQRILTYVETGKKLEPIPLPSASKAMKSTIYPFAPQTQILWGAYKNDLATRNFFKELIGDHFHFTAYGIDWINERWYAEDPPTYAEFASFWQKEYEIRKIQKAMPKKEWAYLNFIQRCAQEHPNFSKKQILKAWEEERKEHVNRAKAILVLH